MGDASGRRLGLIGLGAVGGRLAARLLERFGALAVLDTDEDKLARACALGTHAAADAGSLGSACEVVLLSLPSPAALREVMESPRGLLAGLREGAIVVDTSTLDPRSSVEWAERAGERGASYLDAPITCSVTPGGGTAAAACGELTFLVGGSREAFDSVRDVLEALGRRFHHLGPPRLGQHHEARQQPHIRRADPGHRRSSEPRRSLRILRGADPGNLRRHRRRLLRAGLHREGAPR